MRLVENVQRIGIGAPGIALLRVLGIQKKLSAQVTGGRSVDSASGVCD